MESKTKFIIVSLGMKYYFKGSDGKIYGDGYDEAREFRDGYALVKKDGKWFFINEKLEKQGESYLLVHARKNKRTFFVGGYITVKKEDGKWYFIDKDFKEHGPYEFAFNFREDVALVKINGRWVKINKEFKLLDVSDSQRYLDLVKEDTNNLENIPSTEFTDEFVKKLSKVVVKSYKDKIKNAAKEDKEKLENEIKQVKELIDNKKKEYQQEQKVEKPDAEAKKKVKKPADDLDKTRKGLLKTLRETFPSKLEKALSKIRSIFSSITKKAEGNKKGSVEKKKKEKAKTTQPKEETSKPKEISSREREAIRKRLAEYMINIMTVDKTEVRNYLNEHAEEISLDKELAAAKQDIESLLGLETGEENE